MILRKKATKTFFFVLLSLFMFHGKMYAQDDKQPDFDKMLMQAKSEHKKVLLYFSGSDWCAPCIKFKKNFIHNDEFKAYADSHILIFNADFPRKKANQLSKELTNQNKNLAEKYNPNGYFPYIVLLDDSGTEIMKWDALPNISITEFIAEISK